MESILSEAKSLDVRFIFIQAKTSEHFDGDEIGTFIYGVKAFFAPENLRPKTNEKMDNLIMLKDEIYKHSIDMTSAPVLDLYYVCCGKWNEGNDLRARVTLDIQPLIDTQNFTSVTFFPYDSEKIITTYKELKKKAFDKAAALQQQYRAGFAVPPQQMQQPQCNTWKCNVCGTINKDIGGDFCSQCGAPKYNAPSGNANGQ